MRRRLLLTDDVPDQLEVLTLSLNDKYDVFSYGSCSEALRALPDIRPDAMLLDVRMSPISGLDFLKEVRAMRDFSMVPAIAVTALAMEFERQTFLDAGFQAVVTKPIPDPTTMAAIIDELIESPRRSARALDAKHRMTT